MIPFFLQIYSLSLFRVLWTEFYIETIKCKASYRVSARWEVFSIEILSHRVECRPPLYFLTFIWHFAGRSASFVSSASPMEVSCYRLLGTWLSTGYFYFSYNAIPMFVYPFQTHNIFFIPTVLPSEVLCCRLLTTRFGYLLFLLFPQLNSYVHLS